ncbi:MAG: hypothetical protein ACI9DG_000252 [Oleispira sp.]|jgi:hypothetical protein
MASILDRYVKRWQRWVAAGFQVIAIEHDNDQLPPCSDPIIAQHLHGTPASQNATP